MLDETMSGEPTALKVINKVNGKLKFLYRKNRFLSPEFRRMLCNAFIQPHFDYACPAWYPNLTEKMKEKEKKKKQNKCIRFCLRLAGADLARFDSSHCFWVQENWHPKNIFL